jgi:Peptidase MA superfamily
MSALLALVRGVHSHVVRSLALSLLLLFASSNALAVPAGTLAGAAVPSVKLHELAHAEAADSTLLAPADSPLDTGSAAHGSVQLPSTPAGYETRRRGWLQVDVASSLAHWAQPLIDEAEAFRAEVNARLGHGGLNRVVVRLAENSQEMSKLAPIGAPYPEYAEGVAYSRLGLILLTAEPQHAGEESDLLTTFRHELAHVALHDALQQQRVPLWFNEGLAIHLSRENAFARSRALWTASLSDNLLPLKQIDRGFPNDIVGVPLAYAQSADVVRFLLRTQDQERFRLLIKRVARGQGFEPALSDSYGMDLYNLETLWLEDVKSRNTLWPVLFSGTVLWTFGVVLITLAWRRKRARQTQILQRWAREEAVEDERARVALLARAERAVQTSSDRWPPSLRWAGEEPTMDARRDRAGWPLDSAIDHAQWPLDRAQAHSDRALAHSDRAEAPTDGARASSPEWSHADEEQVNGREGGASESRQHAESDDAPVSKPPSAGSGDAPPPLPSPSNPGKPDSHGAPPSDAQVPRVQHDGGWHTLH